MTIIHDSRPGATATTRRARRQLDEAASLLEVAAFAALMGGSVDDIARMSACTDALTVLADLGARSAPDPVLPQDCDAVAEAVRTLRGMDRDAFTDPHHAGVISQLADDPDRHFLR